MHWAGSLMKRKEFKTSSMKVWLTGLIAILALDAGCQKPEIIFSEDFESPSMEGILANWNAGATKNAKGMKLVGDAPHCSKGNQSLMITYTPGKDEGGHLFKTFPEGYDSLFVRFYVKFITRKELHHFVKLGGYNPLTPYPQGGAGSKPKGDHDFVTGIEQSGGQWNWLFYSYWMNMRSGPNPQRFYGNIFLSEKPTEIPKAEWVCVEFKVKLNNPVYKSNGEQAFWINGKKILHLGEGFPNGDWNWGKFSENPKGAPFEGFQWRSDEKLKLNYLWLDCYITKGDGQEQVLIDDLVVSRNYIGPIRM